MTKTEMAKVLAIIRAGIPTAYLRLTQTDAEAMAELWAALFAECDADMVTAAATAYIWNDETGKFPPPGAIRKWIVDIEAMVENCSFGYTVREYAGPEADRFPPGVRDYIERKAKEIGRMPWRSQTERMRSRMTMMLAGKRRDTNGSTGSEAQQR